MRCAPNQNQWERKECVWICVTMEMRSFPYSSVTVAPCGCHTSEELKRLNRNISRWQYSLYKTGEAPILPMNSLFRGTAWDAVKLIALWAEGIQRGTWLVLLHAMRGVLEPRLLKSSEHVCTRRLPCTLLRETDVFLPTRLPSAHVTSFVEGRWYSSGGMILYLKQILRVGSLFMDILVHILCATQKDGFRFALQRDVNLKVHRSIAAPIVKKTPLFPLMFNRSEFAGQVMGFVFKSGVYGTGYYLDAEETMVSVEYCETFRTTRHTFFATSGHEYTGRWLRTP